MPAFFDPSEFSASSTMPSLEQFDNAVLIPGLSKLIGGDCLLSTWRARPRNKKLLTKHLERGAMIVEIKRGQDLPTSLLNRRTNHLAKQAMRMIATGAQPVQRVLLYTGVHLPTKEGNLRIGNFDGHQINWTSTEYSYSYFQLAKTKLMDSGLLRWEGLASDQEIPVWVAAKLRHLEEYKTRPVKHIKKVQLPFSKEVFREMRESEGAQAILALFDDIGLVGADRIMEYCGSMAWAVQFLTNPKHAGQVRGIGKKTIEKFRRRFGLVNQYSDYGMFVLHLESEQCEICPKWKENQK